MNHMQALDLTVNEPAKHFTENKFVDWHARQVISGIESGVDEINVDLKLSVLKPLHASLLIQLYNHMTSLNLVLFNKFILR